MKILKIALLSTVAIVLSSFVLIKKQNTTELVAPPVDEATYVKFLKKFEVVRLPYSIKSPRAKTVKELEQMEESNDKVSNNKYLGNEFAEILPSISRGQMSRMGPDDYAAEVLLATNKAFDVLIYARIPSFRGGKTYYVATFSKKGTLISQRSIGGTYFGRVDDFEIGKDLAIQTTSFDTKDFDYDDRDAKISYKLTNTRKFTITDEGQIEEVKKQTNEKQSNSPSGLGSLDANKQVKL